MAMEINSKCFPSFFALSFDQINEFGEERHKESFCFAIKKFITGVDLVLGNDAEIYISKMFLNDIEIFGDNNWLSISNLLIKMDSFSDCVYYSEDFEIITDVKVCELKYKIYFNSDPVVFRLERV